MEHSKWATLASTNDWNTVSHTSRGKKFIDPEKLIPCKISIFKLGKKKVVKGYIFLCLQLYIE